MMKKREKNSLQLYKNEKGNERERERGKKLFFYRFEAFPISRLKPIQ